MIQLQIGWRVWRSFRRLVEKLFNVQPGLALDEPLIRLVIDSALHDRFLNESRAVSSGGGSCPRAWPAHNDFS